MKKYFLRNKGKAFLALSIVSLIGMDSTQAMQPVTPRFTMTCPDASTLKSHGTSKPEYVIYEGEATIGHLKGHLFESEPQNEAIFSPLLPGAVAQSGRTPDGRLMCMYVNAQPQYVQYALHLYLNDKHMARECRVTPHSADFVCKKGGGY